jgi:hypothetical protein
MFDAATTALLRAVLGRGPRESVSDREIGPPGHVASKVLEAATRGEVSQDELTQAGRDALSRAPAIGADRSRRA